MLSRIIEIYIIYHRSMSSLMQCLNGNMESCIIWSLLSTHVGTHRWILGDNKVHQRTSTYLLEDYCGDVSSKKILKQYLSYRMPQILILTSLVPNHLKLEATQITSLLRITLMRRLLSDFDFAYLYSFTLQIKLSGVR